MFWRLRILAFYSILGFFVLAFFAFCCVPMHYLNAGYNFRYKVAESFSYIFVFLAKTLCGIKYEVMGMEKLPKDGKPHIVLANHQSFWENLFMQLIIPKHSWVIKQELFDIPIFGWCLRTVNPIAVDRSNSRSVVQILNEGQRKIEDGLSIIMFPEATRVKIDKNVKFKPSAAKLAMNTNVPIVLIVHNAGVYWPKGFWFRKSGLISVKILEIIPVQKYKDYDVRTLTDYIENRINKEKEILVRKVEENSTQS
jgi:1-acyl-sn-glycerol-3-phosphate acyltransferase